MSNDDKTSNNLWKQRLNIGLLGDPMHSEQDFWVGVADAAETHDVNLFVFLGGAVMTHELKPTVRYGLTGIESAAVLYDLVDVERMDGLVTWAGTGAGLGIHLNHDEMDGFFRHYHPLPIVNYEKVVEGIPSVLTDTAQGMRELLMHMIETHGSRRIALLRGPATHFESNERHRAYLETLTEYGLPLNSDLVCTATGWDVNQGRDMIHLLLNERGLRVGQDFDTLIGTEGQFIVSAVRELQSQGIRIPGDLLAAGYNDTSEASATIPSITVMKKSFYNAGWQSLELLIQLIQNKPVPEQTFVPSELIIRRSCGCWSQPVQQLNTHNTLTVQSSQQTTASLSLDAFAKILTEQREEVLAALTQRISILLPSQRARELAMNLFNTLVADITNASESSNVFLTALETAVQTAPTRSQDLNQWHSVISILQDCTKSYVIDDPSKWFQIGNLWQQARVVIQLEAQRREQEYGLEDLLLALNLRETDRRLMDAFDMSELLNTIAQELPRLGVSSGYITLYEKPQPYTYPQVVPERSRLVLGFDERGRVQLPPDGELFHSRHLIPDDVHPPDKAASWIVVPLYIGQRQYGFALLKAGPKKGTLYTELWQLISNALKVVFLMKERLELAVARERVAILANFIQNVGHEFRTPLSIINTSLYLLNKQYDSQKHPIYLERLQNQSTHIQTLVEAMLTMSRLDSVDDFVFARLNITDLLKELDTTMRSLADEKQIILTIEADDDLPYIQGDRRELFRALSHLVENAIQYTSPGGETKIRAYLKSSAVIIEVADTGIGIHEADVSRIFERFYRVDVARTNRGAGLGLSIAQKIIDLHHGIIEVVSEPNRGSVFRVILPFAADRHTRIEQSV